MTRLYFYKDRETKGAVLYNEVDDNGNVLKGDAAGAKIGQLYLRKWWLNGKIPEQFHIVIEDT